MVSLITFSSEEEKINKLKEWELLSIKAKCTKPLKYKGAYTFGEVDCEIIGYLQKETKPGCINNFYETAVIKINENTYKICPAYLKQMQSKNFAIFDFKDTEN